MKKGVGVEGRAWHTLALHFHNSGTVPQTIFNERLTDSGLLSTPHLEQIRVQINSMLSSPQEHLTWPRSWMKGGPQRNSSLGMICWPLEGPVWKGIPS